MPRNRFGLPRTIPARIKKQVRKRCGFGCVICGQIPVSYDHCRVEYKDARKHDPDDIYLLCHRHHFDKTSRLLQPEDIEKAAQHKTGKKEAARFKQAITRKGFIVKYGTVTFKGTVNVIEMGSELGLEITLRLEVTTRELEPILISGEFRDRFGKVLCSIDRNEFVFHDPEAGDFINTKNRFLYKLPTGDIAISFSLQPNELVIDSLFHVRGGGFVVVDGGALMVGNSRYGIRYEDVTIEDFETAMSVYIGYMPRTWTLDEMRAHCTTMSGFTLANRNPETHGAGKAGGLGIMIGK